MLLHEKLKEYNIVLVSQSPRRRELLKGLDIEFTSCSVDTDETYPDNLSGSQIPTYIAEQKAKAYKSVLSDNTLAITADTVVLIGDKIMGKPQSVDEAKTMLKQLSGATHKVITGVCIFTKSKERSFHTISEVSFCPLSDEEIDYYISKYQPFDKAGSYGVQEWIGYIGIEKLVGSYFNVMGLPVQRLYRELTQFVQ